MRDNERLSAERRPWSAGPPRGIQHMSDLTTNDILNRLQVIHACSLPSFLAYTHLCWPAEQARAAEVLADIVADQQEIVVRAGELIVAAGGVVVSGRFPDRFSALHDLSFAFLLGQLVQYQDRTITAIDRLVHQLPPSSVAQELAQDALGKAKAHRDALRDLTAGSADQPARDP